MLALDKAHMDVRKALGIEKRDDVRADAAAVDSIGGALRQLLQLLSEMPGDVKSKNSHVPARPHLEEHALPGCTSCTP